MAVTLGTGIVGCGLIGRRRAAVAATASRSRLVAVTDVDAAAAHRVADEHGAEVAGDWRTLIARDDIDALVVATPNAWLEAVGTAALEAGKHVLIEKPMGRNLAEARRIAAAAVAARRVLKVGFNHRYHPAIREAHRRFTAGEIGRLINLRARYGHGGRPGYEKEWRGDRALAGGGELTDQGVHVLDLMQWFAGEPLAGFAALQTAVWPLGDLEDNGFALLRFDGGVVGSFHTSWTQWKNLFSLEIFGEEGALLVEGLGRSYGVETITVQRRRIGGPPEETVQRFEGEDSSWTLEWEDFLGAVLDGRAMLGGPGEGLAVMRALDALYRSAAAGRELPVRDVTGRPAAFLDRDGVLNDLVEREGRLLSPRRLEEFRIRSGTREAVDRLRELGYAVFVVTNQPDVARGGLRREVLGSMHERLQETLGVDQILACVHDDPDRCDCRKPRPGLLRALADAHGIDLAKSVMIGDSWRDVDAAAAAGCRAILIGAPTGEGSARPDAVVASLAEALAVVEAGAPTPTR